MPSARQHRIPHGRLRAYDRSRRFWKTDRSTYRPSWRPALTASRTTSVPATCIAAGAVLHTRDGHSFVGHYGYVQGEIAVCMKSVGLADRSDLGVFELQGDQALLDRALVARFGDPPLAAGNGRRLRSVWFIRTDARHTLLVGPHAALASGPPIGKGRDRSDLPHRDIGDEARDRQHHRPARLAPADGRRPARRPGDRRRRRRPRRPRRRRDPAREPAPLPRARARRRRRRRSGRGCCTPASRSAPRSWAATRSRCWTPRRSRRADAAPAVSRLGAPIALLPSIA